MLVAVSGFLFETGSESLCAGGGVEAVYAAGIMACGAAPIAGFALHGDGRVLPARFFASLPGVSVLAAPVMPALYRVRVG